MGWVAASDFTLAQPDPLADAAPGILAHMNADHADSLLLLTRTLTSIDAESSTMTAIDRLGFHVAAKTADGIKGARIPFPREATSAADTRTVLVEMVRQARSDT